MNEIPSREYPELRAALIRQPVPDVPALEPQTVAPDTVTLEDLVEAEALSVHEAPPTVAVGEGDTPMLCAKDIRLGRAASRFGNAGVAGVVRVCPGDVAVAMGTESGVRVCTEDGVLLGPGIQLVRGDADTVDPHFLAGVLRAAVDSGPVDLYRVAIPRIPLGEQQRMGVAFRQLADLEALWRLRRASVEQLVRTGMRGLAQGGLRPATPGE